MHPTQQEVYFQATYYGKKKPSITCKSDLTHYPPYNTTTAAPTTTSTTTTTTPEPTTSMQAFISCKLTNFGTGLINHSYVVVIVVVNVHDGKHEMI